ncbi:restriction endonuclease [Nostoc sp. FACHB-87]|nr:restriction endonuclease [Nostoc sp. FACHB-87]MBD2479440.1 restriction endonuclease [Anabaena sp. FACHB-83]
MNEIKPVELIVSFIIVVVILLIVWALSPTKKFKRRLKRKKSPKRQTKHQRNINHANAVLQWLRSKNPEAELPTVIATLRKISPYVFEELLLTCCQEQGWRIERNLRYSGDGGVDGRVWVSGSLYLIQAKRYADYINPQHIQQFQQTIEQLGASGGFFIHTGKTGDKSKQMIGDCPQVILVSGQKLVDFVLGKPVQITSTSVFI